MILKQFIIRYLTVDTPPCPIEIEILEVLYKFCSVAYNDPPSKLNSSNTIKYRLLL